MQVVEIEERKNNIKICGDNIEKGGGKDDGCRQVKGKERKEERRGGQPRQMEVKGKEKKKGVAGGM